MGEIDSLECDLDDVIIVSYEGDVQDDTGAYHGMGCAILDNDCMYEGEFVQGLFHGKGKFTWPDGVSYEGDFYRNHLTGVGTYTYVDGSTYVGDVLDGKRSGNGKLTNSIGQVYEGSWRDGKRNGPGRMYYNEEMTILYTVKSRFDNIAGSFDDFDLI